MSIFFIEFRTYKKGYKHSSVYFSRKIVSRETAILYKDFLLKNYLTNQKYWEWESQKQGIAPWR